MLSRSVSSWWISATPQRRSPVDCQALRDVAPVASCSRRASLFTGVVLSWSLSSLPPAAFGAKLPKGFTIVQDKADGYQYLAPFGWQEVEVAGQDSVYKDLIEPLESVSVTLIPTDKKSITEFGPVDEVAFTLANKVLTPPSLKVKILATAERIVEGTQYYSFEFETRADNYARHALGVVAVGNGNFYALTTGSSERRWTRLEERLKTVIKSFQVVAPQLT